MKNIKIVGFCFIISFIGCIFRCELFAEESFINSAFFTYENDSIFGADRYYSNGVQLFFISKNFKSEENKYIKNIFDISNKHHHNYTFGVGQKMFTPRSIKDKNFLKYDRPYAGYLYFFLNKSIFHDNNKYDVLGLNLGFTGKMSRAEWTQKKIHDIIGSPEPQGWNYQLSNEFLAMASWVHMEMLNFPTPLAYDWNIIPKLYVNLGTPYTDVKIAMELRYGWNLLSEFLPNKIQNLIAGAFEKSDKISYYGFFEVESNFVVRNTFLDGNLFKSDHNNIHTKYFYLDLMFGGTLEYKNFYVKLSNIYMTKEYKEQKNDQLIFSLTGGWNF